MIPSLRKTWRRQVGALNPLVICTRPTVTLVSHTCRSHPWPPPPLRCRAQMCRRYGRLRPSRQPLRDPRKRQHRTLILRSSRHLLRSSRHLLPLHIGQFFPLRIRPLWIQWQRKGMDGILHSCHRLRGVDVERWRSTTWRVGADEGKELEVMKLTPKSPSPTRPSSPTLVIWSWSVEKRSGRARHCVLGLDSIDLRMGG